MSDTDEPAKPKNDDKAANPAFILIYGYLPNPDGTKEVKVYQYDKDSLSADVLTDTLLEDVQQHYNQLDIAPTDDKISAAREEVREIIRSVIEHSDDE